MKYIWLLLVLVSAVLLNGCVSKNDFPVLKGPYLGQ